jgi:hypothetical protein
MLYSDIQHTNPLPAVPRQNVWRHNVRGTTHQEGQNVRRDKTSGRTKRPAYKTSMGTKHPET